MSARTISANWDVVGGKWELEAEMLHGLRRRLTYANVVATLALVLATGGTAVAAVMISSNSQVAANTISGHAAPSGKHANIIAGSVNASDLNGSVTSSIKVHCPTGMMLGAKDDLCFGMMLGAKDDLCFEPNTRTAANFNTAANTCSALNRHLPDISEITEVLDHSSAPTSLEWSSNVYYDETLDRPESLGVGQDDDRALTFEVLTLNDPVDYRCVSTPVN